MVLPRKAGGYLRNLGCTLTDSEQPLVTFALFAYNQEKYIRAAVAGAFEQTYSPLEIVLSDDCSTDGTFEIMRAMSAEYKGPHKIVLNRNNPNIGLGPHVFGIARIGTGKLLIAAAGDDVSLPNRTQAIVEKWLETKCSALTTDEEHYDESGVYMGYFHRQMMAACTVEDFSAINKSLGCTWGIERELLLKYSIPSRDMINEDVLLGLIAMLHKGITYLPTATVKRTTGVGISSNRNFASKLAEKVVFLNRRAALLEAIIEVLRSADDRSAMRRAEKDLKAVIAMRHYARTGSSFFNVLLCIPVHGKRSHLENILKIPIFRWMNARGYIDG